MSELKAEQWLDYAGEPRPCYPKSEADKVIAEKDKQIDLYKRGWEESDRINEHLYAQLRHSNRNRCLAMAKWCNRMFSITFGKERYWQKWNRKWLELAERFKGAWR